MRKLIILWIALVVVSLQALANDKVSFTASAPDAVAVGDQFRLAYTVTTQKVRDFRAPSIKGFDVLMGPSRSQQSSMQIVNGVSTSTSSITFTYILMATAEGSFTIPGATITADGNQMVSNSVQIKVLPADQAGAASSGRGNSSQQGNTSRASSGTSVSNQDLFILPTISKTNVYEQEAFLLTYKIYTLVDLRGFDNVKLPDFKGFHSQEVELPGDRKWSLEHYKGRNYQTTVYRQFVLFPQQSGNLTIDPARFDASIAKATHVSDPFEAFFNGGSNYIEVKKTLMTPKLTVDVKPLPGDKPADFSGGVGEFSISSSINSTNVKTDDAVTVKVKISGIGNIKLIKNPEVAFPNDFDVYDPKVEVDIKTTAAGTSGTKTIEYMAIPRYAGDFEIPAIAFSYFDTKTGSYKTITSEPYKLHVEQGKGGGTSSPVVSNFSNKESVKYLGKDIRYLKVNGIHFVPNNELFFGSFMYYMCYLIPAILFIVFFFIYRKQVKENSNLALVRTKKANKMAVRRLKNAGKLMKENKKEEFYDEVLRALWGYLSDKLSIPQANLTKDNVETELAKYGVDDALIKEFMDILNTCEFARYAPAQASDAMDKLYEQTVDAIGKMENTIKK